MLRSAGAKHAESTTTRARTKAGSVRGAFEDILCRYDRARSERFGKAHPLWSKFEAISAAISSLPRVAASPDLTVRWSAGQGQWATIPWIAVLDTRETSKPSEGVYTVYLFCGDMSGVYLTLSQGASSLPSSRRGELSDRAAALRIRCKALAACGFDVKPGLDLRSKVSLASDYEHCTIAFKLYARGSIPSDGTLMNDLAQAVDCYQRLVPLDRIERGVVDE